MKFESIQQPEEELSYAERAKESRLKSEKAIHGPGGESIEDEFKRANILITESKRADLLEELASL